MANYVIILWSMRKNNQLLVFSNYRTDNVKYGHTRVVRNGKYITLDEVVPHPRKQLCDAGNLGIKVNTTEFVSFIKVFPMNYLSV